MRFAATGVLTWSVWAGLGLLHAAEAQDADGCNGYAAYCNQPISQVLWIGAHNALTDTGFALQRNQFGNPAKLLDAGVRYFDVDTCAYIKEGKRMAPMVCHGFEWLWAQIYQPTAVGLQAIKVWLDTHPREVIFLNLGDIADFTALSAKGLATTTPQLRAELVATVRYVFGTMAVLRGDPWDDRINANTATLQDLISANRRVIVNIDVFNSQSPTHWGQNDRVCTDEWYEDPLKKGREDPDYNWAAVIDDIETTMRRPCAQSPLLLNKLEFQFHNSLGGIIDADSVGTTLSSYMDSLEARNRGSVVAPYFPFNLVLTDHSDKWSQYYSRWHTTQLRYLKQKSERT